MSAMIQIRNVPDDIYRKLKSQAALAGMSLSEFLLRQVSQVAVRPSLEDILARLHSLPTISLYESLADALHAEREER